MTAKAQAAKPATETLGPFRLACTDGTKATVWYLSNKDSSWAKLSVNGGPVQVLPHEPMPSPAYSNKQWSLSEHHGETTLIDSANRHKTCKEVTAAPAASPSSKPSAAVSKAVVFAPGEATDPNAVAPPIAAGSPAATLEVAGVKLGMTPEQALAALRAYDSGFHFQKRYVPQNIGLRVGGAPSFVDPSRGQLGESTPNGPAGLLRCLIGANGVNDALEIDTEHEHSATPVDPEIVSVYFSPESGNHRVIGVALWRSLTKRLMTSALSQNVLAKFPSDATQKGARGRRFWWRWRFDRRNRLLSEDTASRLDLLNEDGPMHGYTGVQEAIGYRGQDVPDPGVVSGGVSVDFVIFDAGDTGVNGITDGYRLSLYDEGALQRYAEYIVTWREGLRNAQLKKQEASARQATARTFGAGAVTPVSTASQRSGLPDNWGNTLRLNLPAKEAYFLWHLISGVAPPYDELASQRPEVKSANEFQRDAALNKARAEYQAITSAVRGVRFLRMNLDASFGQYDGRNKEFNFALKTDTVWFAQGSAESLHEERPAVFPSNTELASSWPLDPAEAERILVLNGGNRNVILAATFELTGASQSGRYLQLDAKFLDYEVRSRDGRLLGKVVVDKPSQPLPELPKPSAPAEPNRGAGPAADSPKVGSGYFAIVPNRQNAGETLVALELTAGHPGTSRRSKRDVRTVDIVPGNRSPVRLSQGATQGFMCRLEPGLPGEFELVRFEPQGDTREVEVKTESARDEVLVVPKSEASSIAFDASQGSEGLVRLVPKTTLPPGEYCLGNVHRNMTRLFCFGIDPAAAN